MENDATVTSHGVEQSADACDTGVCAVYKANGEHQAENCGSSSALRCLKNELDDGHACWGGKNGIDVDKAEEDDQNKTKAPENSLLVMFSSVHIYKRISTYVTPPITMEYIMALGASLDGFGISSVMWRTTSNAMRERADCNRPKIQAMPSDQPVSLVKSVKTNSALVFSDMESRTMLMMTNPKMDQYTILMC